MPNLVERAERYIYKRKLEKLVGHKCPTVKVLGKLAFERINIEIGLDVVLYPDITFSGCGKIIIEDGCKIGKGVIIHASEKGGIKIGQNTIIAAQSYIIDSNHSIRLGEYISHQPCIAEVIEIGSDVWIGANVTIIKGASIGNGAVIGAKSLVNKRIGENEIAYGIPARTRSVRK